MGVTSLALAILLPLLRAWRKTGKSSRLLIGLQSRLLRRMSPEVALLPRTVGAFA
jgi:hypothetical protein